MDETTHVEKPNIYDCRRSEIKVFRWDKKGSSPVISATRREKQSFVRLPAKLRKRLLESGDKVLERNLDDFSNRIDLKESSIVMLLKSLISVGALEEDENEKQVINMILSLPFDETFLPLHLKKLSIDEVMILLKHLLQLLAEIPAKQGRAEPLPLSKILCWLGLILDSHFNALILSKEPEIRLLLDSLSEEVAGRMAPFEDLESLHHLLEIVRLKLTLPKSSHSGTYCIESLHI